MRIEHFPGSSYLDVMKPVRAKSRLLLSALIALALAMSALAHSAVPIDTAQADTRSEFDLSAYVLPDGTLPSYCLNEEDEQTRHTQSCGFCTLSHGVGLPECGEGLLKLAGEDGSLLPSFTAQLGVPDNDRQLTNRGPPDLS